MTRRRWFPVLRLSASLAAACAGAWSAAADDSSLDDVAGVLRVALPLAGLAGTWLADDPQGRSQWLWSTGTSLATAYALKAVVHEQRPDGSGNDAFPSGHATAAFAGAAFIDRRYGRRYGWPAYAIASWVAWSRVETDQHDTLDVLAGAALAVGVTWWMVSERPDRTLALDLSPGRSTVGVGVRIGFR